MQLHLQSNKKHHSVQYSTVITSRTVIQRLFWLYCLLLPALFYSTLQEKPRQSKLYCRAQWFRGRASDSRLREPGFESWLRRYNLGQVFSLYIAPVHSAELNEYLAIDSGGYVYEQPSRINCSIWLDASQRSRDGV